MLEAKKVTDIKVFSYKGADGMQRGEMREMKDRGGKAWKDVNPN